MKKIIYKAVETEVGKTIDLPVYELDDLAVVQFRRGRHTCRPFDRVYYPGLMTGECKVPGLRGDRVVLVEIGGRIKWMYLPTVVEHGAVGFTYRPAVFDTVEREGVIDLLYEGGMYIPPITGELI